MDRGKRATKNKNSKIYMDLKDIVRESVLPYLPAKSLFRFTGVCREWKLQISTPFFAHNQSNCLHSTSGFFYQTPAGVLSFMSVNPMACGVPDPALTFLPEPVDVRTSSNGLLCCQGRRGCRAYYVCNPVTKQWKKLPKPDNDHGPDPALVLIFEPSLLNFIADFKLVCAFTSELDGLEFEIYSSQEGSWRTSGEICFANMKVNPNSGVHVNRTVYWRFGNTVISFDLTSERSQLLFCAPGPIGTMNGKLCAANLRSQQLVLSMLWNTHSNTMQMKSHAGMWAKMKLNVPIPGDTYDYGGTDHANGVIYVGGDIVLARDDSNYYSYDMKTRATTSLGQFNVDNNAGIFGYVNSLVEL